MYTRRPLIRTCMYHTYEITIDRQCWGEASIKKCNTIFLHRAVGDICDLRGRKHSVLKMDKREKEKHFK